MTVSKEEVTYIHERLVQDFVESGDPIEPPGVRSIALLDSAVSRQNTSLGATLKYSSAEGNAATLLYGICCNHPFHNGNKRTALVAMLVHLDRHNLVLDGTRQNDLLKLVIEVASHKFSRQPGIPDSDTEVEAVRRWIAKRVRRISRLEHPLTFRQLRRILGRFGFVLQNSSGGFIDILREKRVQKGFLRKRQEIQHEKFMDLSYHGEGQVLPVKTVRQVRKACKLTEMDGCDSRVFYDNEAVIDAFVNEYRVVLRRLAKK